MRQVAWTRKVTLFFKKSEILDDVNQYAFVEGDIMNEQKDGHSVHQTFDIVQDGNRELCTRIISLVLSVCTEILFPFTKKEVSCNESRDDVLEEPGIFTIEMTVPDQFSQTTADLLEKLIHQLIVYRILENWLFITKPDAAAKWKAKADALEEDIEDAKSIRVGRTRKGQSPF